jgi:hypothetical protein
MADANGAQSLEFRVHITQDGFEPFPGIAENFANGEGGEAVAQVCETGQSEQVVIAVCGHQGSGDGPEGEETVVEDVEGFGLVAEVVLAVGSRALFGVLVRIGVRAGLVGAGVIIIPNSG